MSQSAEPPQQQPQQRGQLSGARGLHCSPRRYHRAALRAQPRAPWSHAPPAPRLGRSDPRPPRPGTAVLPAELERRAAEGSAPTRNQELAQGTVREVPIPSPLREWSDRGLRARVEVHLAKGAKTISDHPIGTPRQVPDTCMNSSLNRDLDH